MTATETVTLRSKTQSVEPTIKEKEDKNQLEYHQTLRWRSVIVHSIVHLMGLYGLYHALFNAAWLTLVWAYLMYVCSMLGTTVGYHRLWAHRTFKAKTPLKIILMLFTCISLQNDVIEWARDHRCHHKWTDTNADPHNAKRGIFYSHFGWLILNKHKDVIEKGSKLDVSDLRNDPVLAFQYKCYWPLAVFCCYVFPTTFAWYMWGEDLWVSFWVQAFRYMVSLHLTFLVNSVAHYFGDKPYDPTLTSAQNRPTSYLTLGEGWHNYHHVFPNDYKTSEVPYTANFSTVFIDFFAWIGWAYDLKTATPEMIERAKQRAKNHHDSAEPNPY